MDDEAPMRVLHGVTELQEETQLRFDRQRVRPAVIVDRSSVDILHCKKRNAVDRPAVEETRDMGMLERCENLALLAETAEKCFCPRVASHQFDRNALFEF